MIEEEIIKKLIKEKVKNRKDLASFKIKISKEYKIPCPRNSELLKVYHKLLENKKIKKSVSLEEILKAPLVRSLSGIVNVSVLTKPYPCPAQCLYCPQEKGLPQSYLSGEPAAERAKRLNFSPYWQVKKRIHMLESQGHPTDKIELRIIGGTWSYYPQKYQEWFVKRCFEASNERTSKIPKTKSLFKIQNLKGVQKQNEKSKHRIVGLSVETRPDFINEKEIRWLRELGVTMVELGVQSIYDDVLALNRRGHRVKETIAATQLLKDAGFKVLYQMMLNLPGSSPNRDIEMFALLFQNSNFRPDYLKIYPCALLKEAPLYKLYRKGDYRPYSPKTLMRILEKIKKQIPPYVRIQRIARDIASSRIVEGGAKISNLRQLLESKAKKEGWQCNCIRCREIRERYDPKEKIYLFRQDYYASKGKEIFLSFENRHRTKLYSLLRLRIPLQSSFPLLKDKALIREVHTYGKVVPIAQTKIAPQHRGLGKRLIKEAQKIAQKEFKRKEIAVISGIGVRPYFRNLGYKLRDTYMMKRL